MTESHEPHSLIDEVHGGLNAAELRAAGLDPETVLDFSVNINPYGPSPRVGDWLSGYDPTRYPDREVVELRSILAALNDVALENVLTGNGTAELIWLAARAFLRPGRPALVVGPTFGEYARAGRDAGALMAEVRASPPGFVMDPGQIVSAIETHRPAVVFLCTPNNPTGQWLTRDGVQHIAAACGSGLLILDEAYRAFAGQAPFGPPPLPNVLVLRSMTKDFALAGLRLGYALGQPGLLSAMRACQPPWSVNGAAQTAGLAVLGDLPHLTRTLELTRLAGEGLERSLRDLGACVLKSHTHFHLVEVGHAKLWRERMLKMGFVLRDCTSFGLPEFARVSTRRPEENERLIQAWAELL